MARLHRLQVLLRWLILVSLWSLVTPWALLSMAPGLQLLTTNFTWIGLRYLIVEDRLPSFAITVCVALTAAHLLWQSRNILWGLPLRERQRLRQQVLRIARQGRRHSLWRWVWGPELGERP